MPGVQRRALLQCRHQAQMLQQILLSCLVRAPDTRCRRLT
jgi:hypothetical protein